MEIKYRSQLVDLMREKGLPLHAAELGVAEGLFSRDLLAAGLEKLYSVDSWEHLEQKGDGGNDQEWHDANYYNAKSLLEAFGDRSKMVGGISYYCADIVDEPLGLVYIDCDHSYEGVKKDIEAWYPNLVSGGIMAFHDYESIQYGVKAAVTEFANAMGLEIHLIPENQPCDAGAYFFKP